MSVLGLHRSDAIPAWYARAPDLKRLRKSNKSCGEEVAKSGKVFEG